MVMHDHSLQPGYPTMRTRHAPRFKRTLTALALLLLAGCSSMNPSGQQSVETPWKSFDDGKVAFDKIVPYQTNAEQLKTLGFDPYTTANVAILNYLEIKEHFKYDDTPEQDRPHGIKQCIDAKDLCSAYLVQVQQINESRTGNFVMDFMNFKRTTKSTGWNFKAIILLKEDLVVYKLWSGKPKVEETRYTKNPLGPLQSIGNTLLEKSVLH